MDIGAAILCGGKSSRMGRDKSQCTLFSRSFLELISNELSEFSEMLISSGEREGGVRDVYPARGPLGGIYSLLLAAKSNSILIVSCDIPLFSRELACFLISNMSEDTDAIICTCKGNVHPLCGIYSKSCIPVLREQLESEDYKVLSALNRLKTKYIDVSQFGYMLTNINTQAQLSALTQNGEPRVFFSRRNKVLLWRGKLIKHFKDPMLLEIELSMLTRLGYENCRRISPFTLERNYICGETALELFSRRERESILFSEDDRELCRALMCCLSHFYSTCNGFCINDMNLGNFVYSHSERRFHCIDLELCSEGEIKCDIGNLLAYISSYEPAETAYKNEMEQYLLSLLPMLRIGITAEDVLSEKNKALSALFARRKERSRL